MAGPRWHGRFRNAGYRLTLPRQTILKVLRQTAKHLSVEDIYLEVHKIYPGIGLTTVYRTLELLTRMGIVSKFDFGDGRSRYELASGEEKKHHHHLICTNCGRIIDYTDFIGEEKKVLDRIEKRIAEKYNFKINSHQVHFYGLCAKCRDKKGGD